MINCYVTLDYRHVKLFFSSFDDQLGLATREQSPIGADLNPIGSLLRSESSEAEAEVVTSAEDVSPGDVAGKVPEVAANRLADLD